MHSCLKILLITALSLHWAAPLASQTQSLQDRFSPVEDTTFVDGLCDSAWLYFQEGKVDSVVRYAEEAFRIAKDTMPFREARASLLLAYGRHDRFRHEEAIALYRHHIALSRQIGRDYDTVIVELNIARCFTHLDQLDSALVYFDKAYQLLDQRNFNRAFDFHFALAFFFDRHYIYDRALDCRRRMYALARENGDSTKILASTFSLGFGFNSDAQYDSAVHFLSIASQMAEAQGNRFLEWQSKACMGISEIQQDNFRNGLQWLESAEPIGQEFGQDLCCGNGAYMGLALVHESQNDRALSYLETARTQLADIADLEDRKNILQALYAAYEELGESTMALEYLKDLQLVRDSMSQTAYQQRIAELDVRLKTDDLMRQVNSQSAMLQSQDKQLSGFKKLIFVLLFACLTALVLWYFEHEKRKRKMAEYLTALEQIDIFRGQPDPSEEQSALRPIESAMIANMENANLTIVDLARQVGTSQRQMNRIVREHSGMSSVQLLRTLRIERAKQYLLDCNRQIAEVAYDTGFSEPAYFTKVFKQQTGLSPSDWREQLRSAS